MSGRAPALGAAAHGYEIRHGRVTRQGGEPLIEADGEPDGCVDGATFGTSWHGVLEGDALRRAFLRRVAGPAGRNWVAGTRRRSRPCASVTWTASGTWSRTP